MSKRYIGTKKPEGPRSTSTDRGQVLLGGNYARLRQERLFLHKPLQQFYGWLIGQILRYQLPQHCHIEDRLSQLLDLVGTHRQSRQGVERKPSIIAEGLRIGRV